MKTQDMAKSSKKRPHKVFVLGAGVSASCGIAVTKDILRASMKKLTSTNSKDAGRVNRLLRYLYPSFDERLRYYPNIEDFLNLLEMAQTFNTEDFIESTLWPREELKGVKRITLMAVTEYIWDFVQNDQWLSLITRFAAKCLRAGDVVITFNWDLALERALENHPQGVQISYRYSHQTVNKVNGEIVILKPHGSINWFLGKHLRASGLRKRAKRLGGSLYVYPYLNSNDDSLPLRFPPLIVPPVSAKRFKYDFLRDTWRSVYRTISGASSLNIIGYSLPKEDQFARFVLRRAIRNNILKAKKQKKAAVEVLVVNPDENVEGTFSRLIGPDVPKLDFRQAYFEDFVCTL